MNFGHLKKNEGWHVQLEPPVIYLDSLGRELPTRNDDWLIQRVTATEVVLSEPSPAPLVFPLGTDHVQSFLTNPSRTVVGGLQYGFLKLHVQTFIKGGKVEFRPCRFSGERVSPAPVNVIEKQVDLQYPNDSGLQSRYQQAGYRLHWANQSEMARRIDLEGWEQVIEIDASGVPNSYWHGASHNRMALLRTRKPDLEAMLRYPYWKQQPGLVSCAVTADASALEFCFQDPPSAYAFFFRMGRDKGVFRSEMKPGRVDTVLVRPVSSMAA